MNDSIPDIGEPESIEGVESASHITVVTHEASARSYFRIYELEELNENKEPLRYDGWIRERLEPGYKTIWFEVSDCHKTVSLQQDEYDDNPDAVLKKRLSIKLEAPEFTFGIVGSTSEIQEIVLQIDEVAEDAEELCDVNAFEAIEPGYPNKRIPESCYFTINLRPKNFQRLWEEITLSSTSEFLFGITAKCLHHELDPVGGYPAKVVRVLTKTAGKIEKHKEDLELFDSKLADEYFFKISTGQALNFGSSNIKDDRDGDTPHYSATDYDEARRALTALSNMEERRKETADTIRYKAIVNCLYVIIGLLAFSIAHSVFS